ncbi:MAG: protein kinase [Bradymonadaceae bacterium]
MTSANDNTATVPADRYERQSVLDRGANATTYLARDRKTDRRCAVKELRIGEAESFQAIRLFEREASVLEQLDHPNIPSYIDDFQRDDEDGVALYIVQEYVDGPTLAEAMETQRWSEDEILELLADLLDVADYLHDRSPPVVHRDIKPDNVILADGDQLALVDFGSVKSAVRPDDDNQTITGTVGYMAPEQFAGRARPATDMYGVAATGVHLLTGTPPDQMLNDRNELEWRSHADPRPPTADLLEAMLARDPDARPPDAAQVAEQMREIARGELASADELPGDLAPSPAPAAGGRQPVAEASPSLGTDWTDRLDFSLDPPRHAPNDFGERFCGRAALKKTSHGRAGCGLGAMASFTGILVVGAFAESGGDAAMAGITGGAAGFCALIALGFLLARSRDSSRIDRARETFESGELTTGTITGSEADDYGSGRNRTSLTTVHYEFTPTEEGPTIDGEVTTSAPKIPASGKPVPVIFDPENPSRYNVGIVDYLS